MNTTLIVFKHEIITTINRRSFWFTTFIFPGLIMFLSVGMQTISEDRIKEFETQAESVEQAVQEGVIGFVDEIDLLTEFPSYVPDGLFIEYPETDSAQQALDSGILQQYFVIPEDFLPTGNFILIDRNFQPLRSSGRAELIQRIIIENLIKEDPQGKVLFNPTPSIINHDLKPQKIANQTGPLATAVPFATMFIFFFVITTSSSYMLQSVTKEKENRTAEILLVSLKPRDLMLGKLLGLGIVALLQMAIWLGGGVLSVTRGQGLIPGGIAFSFPPGFIFWAVLYFVLGYLLYGSMLGAIGVLASNTREGGQFTFLVIFPLLIPIWLNVALTQYPNGGLSTFLSLFPLTAPSAMLTRMVAGNVPIWQTILGLVGLAITTYLFVLLSSRLFRADTLLSDASLNWKRILVEIRKSLIHS